MRVCFVLRLSISLTKNAALQIQPHLACAPEVLKNGWLMHIYEWKKEKTFGEVIRRIAWIAGMEDMTTVN